MAFHANISNTPRPAKCAVLALAVVTGIILLMNSRISSNLWEDGRFTTEMFPANSENLLEERGQSALKINISHMLSENELLVNDPTSCFKKYDVEAVSAISSVQMEATASKKSIPFFHMLSVFNELMASLNIKVAIIEPSVLYCSLDSIYQELLKKRNFSITEFEGSNSVLTCAITEDDVNRLQKEDNIIKFRDAGFQPYFYQAASTEWMLQSKSNKSENYTSRAFYSYYKWTVHIVVFQKRNNYLWHAGLKSNDIINIPHGADLLFTSYESAYENFTFVRLDKWPNIGYFYIPSSPHYFLFQIPFSRFLECNLTRAVAVKSSKNSEVHSHLSEDEFNSGMLFSLEELKKLFNPLLMHFWIFSGTMLGWYRQCDIIPYTSDVDYAAWASEIDDLDYLINHFLQNKNLTIRERMGVLEEALEFNLNTDGLRVDVFFMYKISNGSWASGHRPSKGYYFRYYYPHFTLCTAELMKAKVQVPCETEDVIVTEYGPNWMKPVSSWGYESSIHNRGPNIYWDSKRRPKTFKSY